MTRLAVTLTRALNCLLSLAAYLKKPGKNHRVRDRKSAFDPTIDSRNEALRPRKAPSTTFAFCLTLPPRSSNTIIAAWTSNDNWPSLGLLARSGLMGFVPTCLQSIQIAESSSLPVFSRMLADDNNPPRLSPKWKCIMTRNQTFDHDRPQSPGSGGI